jgi:hypothetical protein
MSRFRPVLPLVATLIAALGLAVRGQTPLSVEAWRDAGTWPELPPGQLGSNLERVPNMRLTMDAVFPGPPRDPTTMYVDVTQIKFQNQPAVWIQFLSTGVENSPTNGTASLDAIVLDRATARALFRLRPALPAPGSQQAWGGSYDVMQYGPDQLVQVHAAEDGTTSVHRTSIPPVTEFAALGFVLPGLGLRPGLTMRIPGFVPGADASDVMPFRVDGRVPFTDAAGADHEVWAVDLPTDDRGVLIRFFVDDAPPFFYGWTYRAVADGSVIMSFTLRRWAALGGQVLNRESGTSGVPDSRFKT